MSDSKPYHITDELGAVIGSVTFNREALLRALNAVPPPPPPPGYTLYPGQDPAVAIADLSAGDNLWLADGTHPYALHLPKAVNVRAADGAAPVVSGWTRMDWTRYSTDGDRVMYRLPWDRAARGLSHHIVTNAAFLAAQDGPARMAAHNAATAPELVRYDGEALTRHPVSQVAVGTMRQGYDDKGGYLYISLPVGADLDLLEVARYPQLFTAADGVAGITVEGITFTGAANTHKQGAVELHSDGNTLRDLRVEVVNSLGYSIRGIGLLLDRVTADNCGQMGHWMKVQKSTVTGCGHTGSNWRGSDAGWHASNKWEQSLDNMIIDWHATDTNGCGLWLDVGNHGNTFEALDLLGCGKNAIMLEHYAERNTFSGRIRGTRPIGRWAGADIQIQSNVRGNAFDGLEITGDAVPYWLVYKTQEGRGPSGPNEFINISTSGRPMLIQPARHEKDIFEAIT